MTDLKADLILDIIVNCSDAYEIGDCPDGFLRVIPIIGGKFTGKINGEVLSLGADWNLSKQNNTSHVFAKYILKADNGELISIENEGDIDNNNSNGLIITKPRFNASINGEFHWLNYGVYVGELNVLQFNPIRVNIKIYKMI